MVRGTTVMADAALVGTGSAAGNPCLATKGAGAPILGYDRHDPHFPFGRLERVSLDESPETPSSLPRREVVVPTAAVSAIRGLLAALDDRDQRIQALEERLGQGASAAPGKPGGTEGAWPPVSAIDLHPVLLAFFNRGGGGKATSTVELAVEVTDGRVDTLVLDLQVTIRIPDGLASRLADADAPTADLPRRVLEGLALDQFRIGRLTAGELRRLLGLANQDALSRFLEAQGGDTPYDLDGF